MKQKNKYHTGISRKLFRDARLLELNYTQQTPLYAQSRCITAGRNTTRVDEYYFNILTGCKMLVLSDFYQVTKAVSIAVT